MDGEPAVESPLLACAVAWRPSAGWSSTVREPYAQLRGGAHGFEASGAWAQIAMMMGDSAATPLALVVCLHAAAALPDGVEDRRLSAHRDLCLLDLGLARARGAVRIGALGDPGAIDDRRDALAVWLVRALAPFGGDLARAAWYALELAAVRTGVRAGPEPTPGGDAG